MEGTLEENLAEAILGRDAEDFLKSELGLTLLGFADQERDEALAKLKTVHPWRTRRIRELQNEVYRAESLKEWLFYLVQRGMQAKQQLESE